MIVGVDIRPTQTTVALADVNGNFTAQETFVTPRDPAAAIALLIKRIRSIIHACEGKKIEGIGISVPGRINRGEGRLVFAPNLKWRDIDLGKPIAKATGLDVELENAANACVLAAVWFDRMDDCRNLVVVTVSEGIGIGIYANGELARGHNNMAGEFGHVPLDPKGPICTCGTRGCWEFSPPIAPLSVTITNRPRTPTAPILRTCFVWRIWATIAPPKRSTRWRTISDEACA